MTTKTIHQITTSRSALVDDELEVQAAGGGASARVAAATIAALVTVATINSALGSSALAVGSALANRLAIAGSATGQPVTLTASGSDASIPIHLAPKGDQGFVQLGPDTYGAAGWAGSDTNIEIYELATRTVLSNAIYVERYAGDIASSVTNGLNFSVGTQGAGATQNIGSIFGIQGNIVSTLPAGRSVGNTFAAATFQASNSGAGSIPFANGVYSEVSNFSTGTIGEGYSFAAIRPRNNGGGTYPNYYAYWADEATEPTNAYYFWADARGVFRIKSDNTFDGVYQAITALYNPQFTKYTAGAANFERIVQYWSGNVATIGTEAGGTGTQRALRLIGASYKLDALTSNGFVKTSGADGTLSVDTAAYATTAYVDNLVTGLLDFKGSTDASGNPNYPAALKGDAYAVSVAGKVGGASGKSVDIGDMYIASADNAGGTEASVGTSWFVLEHNLVGAVVSGGALGTPSSGTLSNCTGLPVSTGITGLGTGVATALAVNVGSAGAPVVNGGALGTPSSGTLTSCTGLPAAGVVGTAAILGANTFTALQTHTIGSANVGVIASTGYSLTGSNATNMADLAGTWNTSGNPVALKIAISNTASGATSKFASFLAGASGTTEVCSIDKAGTVTIGSSPGITLNANGNITGGNGSWTFNGAELKSWNGGLVSWSSTSGLSTADFAIGRNAAGVGEANNGTPGTFRDLKVRDIIINGATNLLKTSAALTNNAAGNTATLLNAPAAGNPTKWARVDDNGTARFIPMW